MIFTENTKNNILTKIYFNDIVIEELNNLSMDLWEKLVLRIAYYEKHCKKRGLQLIKQAILQMELTQEQKMILNKLRERLSSKKMIFFDCGLYCDILNCSINGQYMPNSIKEKNLSENTTVGKESKQVSFIKKEEPPKKENKPKMIGQEGRSRNRYNTNIENNFKPKGKQKKQVLFIKDVFAKELLEIKKYVYWEMNWGTNRLGATRIWDTLEFLEEKDVKDEVAYNKMLRIIAICVRNNVMKLETQNTRKLENKRIGV